VLCAAKEVISSPIASYHRAACSEAMASSYNFGMGTNFTAQSAAKNLFGSRRSPSNRCLNYCDLPIGYIMVSNLIRFFCAWPHLFLMEPSLPMHSDDHLINFNFLFHQIRFVHDRHFPCLDRVPWLQTSASRFRRTPPSSPKP
jgi:hypothetical protein